MRNAREPNHIPPDNNDNENVRVVNENVDDDDDNENVDDGDQPDMPPQKQNRNEGK